MQVQEIWRYPVKSVQGERLSAATIGPTGIEGDRAWALLDADSGKHLTARRVPELLFASARLVGDKVADGVRITLPDGTETDSDQTLSAWLGRPVRLQAAGTGVEARFETQPPDVDGPWLQADSRSHGRFAEGETPGDLLRSSHGDETETGEWLTWNGPAGSFHDSGRAQVSLVSESAFGSWDRRRFRINLVLDQPGDVALVGSQVAVGGAELDVLKQIDRCVMTTRPQPAHDDGFGSGPAIERDLEVLRTINRDFETYLGVGAVIVSPGPIAIGDAVASVTD